MKSSKTTDKKTSKERAAPGVAVEGGCTLGVEGGVTVGEDVSEVPTAEFELPAELLEGSIDHGTFDLVEEVRGPWVTDLETEAAIRKLFLVMTPRQRRRFAQFADDFARRVNAADSNAYPEGEQ